MKFEKEITVKVNVDYDTLHKDLLNKGFKIVEQYQLNDIYMIPKDVEANKLPPHEILQSCILIRNIIDITKKLVYKYKKYNDKKEIIEEGKIQCGIENVEDAIKFMEVIGYKNLLEIKDKCLIYSNGEIAIAVQIVNGEHLFIELEEKNEHVDKEYNDIEEMKKDLLAIGLDCDYTNYFVRKAEIIFNGKYK